MNQVKDFMQHDVLSVRPDSRLLEAAQRMIASGSETVLVMDGERLVGTIGLRDLFTAPVPAHYGGVMRGKRDAEQLLQAWEQTPVSYLMNQDVITIGEDAPLLLAAELMVNMGKHPLPVLREDTVVGTVSRGDVVRGLLATRKLA